MSERTEILEWLDLYLAEMRKLAEATPGAEAGYVAREIGVIETIRRAIDSREYLLDLGRGGRGHH
jgi:hypothetical protein